MCPGSCSNDQSFLPGYNGNTKALELPLPSKTTCTYTKNVNTNCNASVGKSSGASTYETPLLLNWIYTSYLNKPLSSLRYTISGSPSSTYSYDLFYLLNLTYTGFGYNSRPVNFATGFGWKDIPSANIKWLANQIKNNAVDSQTTLIAEDLLSNMYNFNKDYGLPFKEALTSLNPSYTLTSPAPASTKSFTSPVLPGTVKYSKVQKFFEDLNILLCPGSCSNNQSFLPGYNGNTTALELPLPSTTTCSNSTKNVNCNASAGKSSGSSNPANTNLLMS